jgi:hypothetical protein
MSFRIPTQANFEITRMPEGWWVLLFLDEGAWAFSAGPFTDRESARRFLLWLLSAGVHFEPEVVQKTHDREPDPLSFVEPADARLELARGEDGWQILVRIDGSHILWSSSFRARDSANGLIVWLRMEGAAIEVEYTGRVKEQHEPEPSPTSWFEEYEREVLREKTVSPDLMDLIREDALAERRKQLIVERTLPDSETIRAGAAIRVACPDCANEFDARAPRFALLPIVCPACREKVYPVVLVLAPAVGVWILDPFYPECNARAFRFRNDEGLAVFAAFCQCGTQDGRGRLTQREAIQDASEHRIARRSEAS